MRFKKFLAALCTLVVLSPSITASALPSGTVQQLAQKRHGDHHHGSEQGNLNISESHLPHIGPSHSHGAPKANFNASDLAPEPLSYYVHDTNDESSHGGLMAMHIACMTIAFFGLWPLNLFLRASKHPLYHVAQLAFVGLLAVGLLFARIYKAATPDLYPNNHHSPVGWTTVAVALALCSVDTVNALRGIKMWLTSGAQFSKLPLALLVRSNTASAPGYERANQEVDLNDEDEETDLQADLEGSHVDRPIALAFDPPSPLSSPQLEQYSSRHSDDTLHENEQHVRWRSTDSPTDEKPPKPSFLDKISTINRPDSFQSSVFASVVKYSHIFLLRWVLFAGYTAFILGVVVYSGKCRDTFVNGCAAHLIKGSIFLIWGLLSFGRYLGAWSELGWSWNRKPKTDTWRRHAPSAEFIECFLIFFYGATNTFMERFGAKAGDAFSIHEIQHISIAILFFGAGMLGLMLESKFIRRSLANGVRASLSQSHRADRVLEPHSYSSTFNPIPALVAALTGLAMSAHHQEYAFAVQVHQLWGYQLVLFGVCRIFTYAFLWLRPPASMLPSRPPTEALASFFCACGGLVFMLSTEQVVFSMMANGLDDIMTINNLALAAVGLLLSWIAVLMAIKGWATARMLSIHIHPFPAV